MKIKRIALIGLGAMGVFFAPRLYEAFGENFYIIAGGERKKRLESKGVTINGVNYRFPIATPEEQGEPADLILIGVKGYGFDAEYPYRPVTGGYPSILLPYLPYGLWPYGRLCRDGI